MKQNVGISEPHGSDSTKMQIDVPLSLVICLACQQVLLLNPIEILLLSEIGG